MAEIDILESPVAALALAVRRAGSQSALARHLHISQNAVSKWMRLGKHLPDKHVLKVEDITGVSRFALRPDLYPDESRHTASADRRRPAGQPAFGAMERTR